MLNCTHRPPTQASNPTHMYPYPNASTFAAINNAGSILDLADQINQGDDFYQRFGSHVDISRLTIRGILRAGSAQPAPASVRITVIRAASGGVVGTYVPNLDQTFNPIRSSSVTQLLFDRFYSVSALTATGKGTEQYPCVVSINLKLKHRQKFNGSGAGTQVGESIYVIMQSDLGTTANTFPVWNAGVTEVYFKP